MTRMADGRFIVLEGIDGSGTTSQAARAAAWLRERGCDVVETFEPTNRAVGRLIRKALRSEWPGDAGESEPNRGHAEPELMALLFAADRLDHMNGRVRPALEIGRWVVSDRCYLSSFAYQSIGCELAWVRMLNRCIRRADLTLLLDVDAETACGRLDADRSELEIFETREQLAAVRKRYNEIAATLEAEGDRIVTIDAAQPLDAVASEIRDALETLL
jgi:dTMP kinase